MPLAHAVCMPRISYFYGISIYMYFDDHLPPHFHATYGGQEASFAIMTLETLKGRSRSRRALGRG